MEQSQELQELTVAWFEAVVNGDTDFMDRHVSRRDGVLVIGSDPSEWWEAERALELIKAQMKELGSAKFDPGDPQAFREGSVGWAAARPRLMTSDGTEASLRWSGVFHRENGDWKLVQVHASIGVSNEEVGPFEGLPT